MCVSTFTVLLKMYNIFRLPNLFQECASFCISVSVKYVKHPKGNKKVQVERFCICKKIMVEASGEEQFVEP